MKLLLFVATLATALVMAVMKSPLLAWASLFVVSALLTSPSRLCGMVQNPTLTTAEITTDFFAAFRKMVPAMVTFGTDFSAARAKKGQQIIAHVGSLPTIQDHDASNFFAGATNAKSLISDVPVTITEHKDVTLKFAAADLSTDRSLKYLKVVDGAAYQLGKAMIDSVLAKANSTNLSYSGTCAAASYTAGKLREFSVAMNTNGAGPFRHGLISSSAMTGLTSDTVVASGDYFDQRQDGSPIMVLRNISGFQTVTEYPDFPSNTGAIDTFTANASTEVITVASAHGLIVGDRVRVSTDDTLPGGLSASTNYFVKTVPSSTTLTLSATSGGSTLNITDTGTGTHTISRYDNINGLFYEDRAIIIATRLPNDAVDLAQQRGVPVPMKIETITDPDTGLTVLSAERFNTQTWDLELCFSVMWGSSIGRQGGAAGAVLDKAGYRVIGA